MPKKREASVTPSKSDLIEATEAIRHVSNAIKKEHQLRRYPSGASTYSAVVYEVAAARLHHRNGLSQLQAAIAAGVPDSAERIALHKAVQELIKSVKLLGEVM